MILMKGHSSHPSSFRTKDVASQFHSHILVPCLVSKRSSIIINRVETPSKSFVRLVKRLRVCREFLILGGREEE